MIKAFYVLNNTLGFGFLEKVYENPFMKFSVLNLGAKLNKKKQLVSLEVIYANSDN